MSKFPDSFGLEYEGNKRKVEEHLEVEGKRLKNRIAGYITRLKNIENREVTSEIEEEG